MKLEVLVAAMHQHDLSLADRMNLRCDTVIANQCGKWGYTVDKRENHTVRMISSDTIGVGLNRNLALQLAEADILLFADDDMRYYDPDLRTVVSAFEELPDADVIVFGVDMTRGGEIYERRRCQTKRAYLWNSMKYGTYRIAVRRSSILNKNIWFSTLFGGGCMYGCGEDSIFLRDCFAGELKVYSYAYVLGTCAKDSSTWFTGYNEKYFFDRGAMVACAFPRIQHLMKWYYIWKFAKKTELSRNEIRKLLNAGIRAYRGKPHRGYQREEEND